MKITDMSISQLNILAKEMEFTEEEKKNGFKWLARMRKIRDREMLTDKEVLDIANHRFIKYFKVKEAK